MRRAIECIVRPAVRGWSRLCLCADVLPVFFALAAVFNSTAAFAEDDARTRQDSYVLSTAEVPRVRVVVLAHGLYRPFSLAMLPSGDALVTERNVALRLVRNATGAAGRPTYLEPLPVRGMPPQLVRKWAGPGVQDIKLHPRFAENGLVYFTYITPGPNDSIGDTSGRGLALMRGKYTGEALENVQVLYSKESGAAYGTRLAFAPDGSVFVTTAAEDEQAQSLESINGKILHFNDDGTVPKSNPFVSTPHAAGEIYSFGHRDPQGIAFVPGTNVMVNVEHGPNGGDEVNVVLPGRNYGWPTVSFGRHYDGRRYSELPVAPGVEQPILVWLPSIAPSGLIFYTGDRFPAWKGNLFTGSARRGEILRTGGLERVVFNDRLEELRRETLLTELHLRIRDVQQGPDGMIYVLSDEDDGMLMRIEPAP